MYQAHYLTDKGINTYLRSIDIEKNIAHKKLYLREEEHANNIIRLVFNYFNVDIETAQKKNRKAIVIRAKQFAQYYIRREINRMPYKTIAGFFKNNHATVIHSVRKIQDLIDVDSEYQQYNNDLSSRIIELYK